MKGYLKNDITNRNYNTFIYYLCQNTETWKEKHTVPTYSRDAVRSDAQIFKTSYSANSLYFLLIILPRTCSFPDHILLLIRIYHRDIKCMKFIQTISIIK